MTDTNGNSEARIGWGTGFYIENASGVLVEIDEVTGLPEGDETADDVEVTHYKSRGRRKEYIAGLIDAGEGDLVINYVPGSPTDTLLREMHQSGQTRAFRDITNEEVGEDMWQVEGFLYIRSRSRARPIGDRMQVTYGVRFTGPREEGEYTAPATP